MSHSLSVHFLPSLFEPEALRGGIAVVIDVLRATTTIIHALAAGALAVIPCQEVDEARRVAATYPTGKALLGGERNGLRIPGFDLDNSPANYSTDRLMGKTVVFTTTNGTRALLRAREADRTVLAGFVNLDAVVQTVVQAGRPVHVVCAGTDGRITLEDCLCAGAIAAAFIRATGDSRIDDQAMLALGAFESRCRTRATFLEALRASRGGANLISLGLGADIETAAQWDRFEIVPELSPDPWRIQPARDALSINAAPWLDPPI